MRKTISLVLILMLFGLFVSARSQQVAVISGAEIRPVTVITITEANGEVFTFTDESLPALESLSQPNALCEGLWNGSNNVSFNLINQTSIDTFKITFTNVGGCSMVEIKSSPVNISGNSFNISYNIPTISSGSLSGTFSEDGQSVSGNFSYSNNQCGGGSKTGTWSAAPVDPCITVLDPPVNLSAAVNAEGVVLEWQAPGTALSDTTEISYDDGTAEFSIQGNFSGAELAVRFTPLTYPVNLISMRFLGGGDVEPDDYGVRVYLDPVAGDAGPVNTPVFDGVISFEQAGTIQADFPTPITVESGDFYVSLFFVIGETGDFVIGRDTNSIDAMRAWLRNASTGLFARSGVLGFPGNFIVRAIVTSNSSTVALASSNFEKQSAVMNKMSQDVVTSSVSQKYVGSYHDYANSQRLYSISKAAALQGYKIYRSETSPVVGESTNLLGSVDANTVTFTDGNVSTGTTYFYAVSAQHDEGESDLSNEVTANVTSVADGRADLPDDFRLQQNFPNPFNPATLIQYEIPTGQNQVSLEVYNTLGKKIRTLVNERMDAGSYQVQWDGRDEAGKQLASGIYVYRLQAGSFVQARKMLLIK